MAKDLRENQLRLQQKLESLLGSRNVYFQPPENLKLEYPCIVYQLSDLNRQFAGNKPYREAILYSVTLITRSPLYELALGLGNLKYSSFDRFYISENLNHYSYRIYN